MPLRKIGKGKAMPRRFHWCALIVCCLFLAGWDAAKVSAGDAAPKRDRVYRIGYLEGGSLWRYTKLLEAVRAALAESGWDKRLEFPPDAHLSGDWGAGSQEKTARMAAELMKRTDLDLVIAMGTEAAIALLAANNGKTPIVGLDITDPIGSGLVRGEKSSGVANFTTSLIPDRWINMFRVFYEVIGFKRLGVLHQVSGVGRAYSNVEDAREVAREKGFVLLEDDRLTDETSVSQCLEAIKRLVSQGIDAFYVSGLRCFDWSVSDPRPLLQYLNKKKIATFARGGLPVVQLGALMGASTLGVKHLGTFHAGQIAAILNGERPSALSMDLRLELGMSLNLQTAKEIGLDFPMEVLVSADVIVVTTDSLDEVRNDLLPPNPGIRLLK